MRPSLVLTSEGLPLGLYANKFWIREKFKNAKSLYRKKISFFIFFKCFEMTGSLIFSSILGLDSYREFEVTVKILKSTLGDPISRKPVGFFEELCGEVFKAIKSEVLDRKVKNATPGTLWAFLRHIRSTVSRNGLISHGLYGLIRSFHVAEKDSTA